MVSADRAKPGPSRVDAGSLLNKYLQLSQSHSVSLKAGLAVQGGPLYKRPNAERNAVRSTRRARFSRVSALLHALQRYPTFAAASAALKPS